MEKPIVKSIIPIKLWFYLIVGSLGLASPALFIDGLYAKVIFGSIPCIIISITLLSHNRFFYETYFIKKRIIGGTNKIFYSDIQNYKWIQGKNGYRSMIKIVLYGINRKHSIALETEKANKLIAILKKNNIQQCA